MLIITFVTFVINVIVTIFVVIAVVNIMLVFSNSALLCVSYFTVNIVVK